MAVTFFPIVDPALPRCTRKDDDLLVLPIVALALAIRRATGVEDFGRTAHLFTMESLIEEIAAALAEGDPDFDPEVFMTKCVAAPQSEN